MSYTSYICDTFSNFLHRNCQDTEQVINGEIYAACRIKGGICSGEVQVILTIGAPGKSVQEKTNY